MGYTIKDIALRAGISKSTVSRVISGKGVASPETREKVLKVMKELQYKPNALARAMVSQRTNNIGVVVYHSRSPMASHPIIFLETCSFSCFSKSLLFYSNR
ncbi:LacI family DNA-binding transcriptional regulator [Saccharococcus caldoxylosilyticus]|uniref:Putative transcriptional regulator n=1 Tax=Parageobacillus caldoxylosilyticus NBRC 107762 TaxID=1220594 RepID=A0A023DIX8_9BACL|nr:LacI family DNA-binding transcriptional regulator [Parageobacillus caldoxylosilyticus]MBB3854225.1 LacI family transcriptional regulator/LacI family purine nucleotide synthesis repressor [Parageobacillus caldoxylosilyticus]GAJ41198.1 putative transcriptional regulator [Parageobacillus caldoxylosilyticus NBRC 107762]